MTDLLTWLRSFRERRLQRPRPAIAMYHRVAEARRDPWGLCVSPANFRKQLQLFRRERQVLPLAEFLRLSDRGKLPGRAVAITFDDGYRDNFISAAPALAEFALPATLFLATGPMRQQRGYWWDVLAAMILDAPPVSGAVTVGGAEVRFALPEPEAADAEEGWRAWQEPRSARQALYVRLWSQIRPLPPGEIAQAMDDLAAILPVASSSANEPMNQDEVLALLDRGSFSLGCHTVDHSDLPALSRDMAADQLARNKTEVENLTGQPADVFAYPYGRHDPAVMKLASEAGFTHACTTQSGRMAGADPLALPRATARDRASIGWLNR